MRLLRARFEFKIEDAWIGIFWKRGYVKNDGEKRHLWTDIWICFLPCFPLHLTYMADIEIPFNEVEK